jgi:peptidoglycan/LPS O-acetylase OafA/YrhL
VTKHRIPSLDGLRAISIALVVLGHLGKNGHAPLIFKSHYTDLGVDLFFVISGYLITTILLQEQQQTSTISLKYFYARRAFRIFPAAFVFILVAVAFYWPQMRWYNIASALLYVANFDGTRPWIFGQLWSLGVEEQFYLLWPSVLKKWGRHKTNILIGVTIFAPVMQAFLIHLKVSGGTIGAWPGVAGTLAAGCLLAIIGTAAPKVGRIPAALMLLALFSIPFFAANTPGKTLALLFVLEPVKHLCMAGLLLNVVQRPYWLLNWAPTVWLGNISYSLYLWQQPFCADPTLRSAYFAGFAIICAGLSYYLVEKPMLRLRDQILTKKRPKVVPYVQKSRKIRAAR